MQVTNLKFPGGFTSAQTIRREVAHEISQLEISAAAGSPVVPDLANFLLDAAQKTPGYTAPAPVLPATQAIVTSGATAPTQNSAGTVIGAASSITVAANAVTNVKLPTTTAALITGTAVTMQNSAGAAVAGSHTATVAAGLVSNVKLAATVAPVVSGVKINAGAVSGTGNFATITVVAGVITAIVLSAS